MSEINYRELVPLEELLIGQTLSYGVVQPGAHVDGGVPIIRANNVKGGRIETTDVMKVHPAIAERHKRTLLAGGELLITVVGALGETAIVPPQLAGWNTARAVAVANVDTSKADIDYLRYCFLLEDVKHQIYGSANTTVQPTLNLAELKRLMMPMCDLTVQRRIAGVLCDLDAKIDLLHQQNQTLEQMARTQYRQWFVEEAQEDWKQGNVSDVITLQRGYDLPVQVRADGKIPILTSSGVGGYHNMSKVTGPGVTTGRSGVLGKVYYISSDFWPLNTSLYVSHFKLASPLYAYFFLQDLDLAALNAGSAVPTLNRNHVHAMPVILPPEELIGKFERLASALFDKLEENKIQIATLENLRDTLLPKLMSGEVRVTKLQHDKLEALSNAVC